MRKPRRGAALTLLAMLALAPVAASLTRETSTQAARLERFFRKRRVTIAVTDSGLGGLSVMAEAASRLKAAGTFERADFVFFNALFSAEGGYNSLAGRAAKVAIFESALESLERRFRPDLILIGCNTLSVLYGDTPFARRAGMPVAGIIGAGVELMTDALRAEPRSSVIIFGTPTTIGEGTYQEELRQAGFAGGRIITQACPELESYIERGRLSDETGLLISAFVEEALQKLPSPPPPLFASLNCSHYGYSSELWERAFAQAGVKLLGILNPNSRMVDFLFAPGRAGRYPKTVVTARVVSMTEISPGKIASLGSWLARTSPETSAALSRYERIPDLFRWKLGN